VIEVIDAETGEWLPDCQVKVYADTRTTDASGRSSFDSITESFILEVAKELYETEKRQQVIFSDTVLTVFLNKKQFDVTFRLLDDITHQAFWGTGVTFGSGTASTDMTGEVVFTVGEGSYEYSISEESYREESGTLTITSDTTFLFYLIRTHADAKFQLKFGTAPLNKVYVIINNDSVLSNNLGIANFKGLPVGADYDYLIRKHGYFDVTGTLFLTTDTTILIAMEAWPAGMQSAAANREIRLWPNPVNNCLYCLVPDICPEQSIRIVDLTGREIYNRTVHNGLLSINVRNYPSGIYLLKLVSGEKQTTRFFIKN
jgi:hypothetical protein